MQDYYIAALAILTSILAAWVIKVVQKFLSTWPQRSTSGTWSSSIEPKPNCRAQAPDYVSPVVAYRVWQWDAAGLKSFNGESWAPKRNLQIKCKKSLWRHKSPHARCTCGIYAAKNLSQLRMFGYMNHGIHGEVYLWGSVVEHELGWRAQYAYPKSLVIHPEGLSLIASIRRDLWIKNSERWLAPLTAYGVDIFVADKPEDTLLWTKKSGYYKEGLKRLRALSPVFKESQRQRIRWTKTAVVYHIGIGTAAAFLTASLGRWINLVPEWLSTLTSSLIYPCLFFVLHGLFQIMLRRHAFISFIKECASNNSREYKGRPGPPPSPPLVPVHSVVDIMRILRSWPYCWPKQWEATAQIFAGADPSGNVF